MAFSFFIVQLAPFFIPTRQILLNLINFQKILVSWRELFVSINFGSIESYVFDGNARLKISCRSLNAAKVWTSEFILWQQSYSYSAKVLTCQSMKGQLAVRSNFGSVQTSASTGCRGKSFSGYGSAIVCIGFSYPTNFKVSNSVLRGNSNSQFFLACYSANKIGDVINIWQF